MRIAIDAMGGDNAPLEIVKGTYLSAVENPAVDILLIGDKAKILEAFKEVEGEFPNKRHDLYPREAGKSRNTRRWHAIQGEQ